ncbi:hypothetical protein HDV02_000575, partial [Globomyces sp. JEL0801]
RNASMSALGPEGSNPRRSANIRSPGDSYANAGMLLVKATNEASAPPNECPVIQMLICLGNHSRTARYMV